MFTGIVEKSVAVTAVADRPQSRRLTLNCGWNDVRLGESVSVNGCCLTVAAIEGAHLGFDVVTETLNKTNLGGLQAGDRVHVERSLRMGDRVDGHFVQGHVDGVAQLVDAQFGPGETRLVLHAARDLMKFIVPKGSIALDGVSLTVAALAAEKFEVALIPTTLAVTELGNRNTGYAYNLEADVLSKTIVAFLERRKDNM
jgi:riboflavin synthase